MVVLKRKEIRERRDGERKHLSHRNREIHSDTDEKIQRRDATNT
jgi:hypothetical protein